MTKFKRKNCSRYPPFSEFVRFSRDTARMKNDPSLIYEQPIKTSDMSTGEMFPWFPQEKPKLLTSHALYIKLPIRSTNAVPSGKNQFPNAENSLRNTVCASSVVDKNCKQGVLCDLCKDTKHPTALHTEPNKPGTSYVQGGEDHNQMQVKSSCTQICGTSGFSKSCAKTILVKVYPDGKEHLVLHTYALIDDQSNRSLARPSFFNHFGENGPRFEYTLFTCSCNQVISGRKASGYVVKSLDGTSAINLPTLLECDNIPNVRDEIPSPDVVKPHPHLSDLKDAIPPLDCNADMNLFIGRDLITAHHVLDQRIGHQGSLNYPA